MGFQVIPSIHLRAGRVVRLRRNGHVCEVPVADDPQEIVARHADAGVAWVHVVDLDGVRDRQARNLAVIDALAGQGRVRLQARAGVRTTDDLRRLYDAGVARVVIGRLAASNPYATAIWLAQFGAPRLVVALDAHRQAGAWRAPVDGVGGVPASMQLETLAAHYVRAGARHVLCRRVEPGHAAVVPDPALYRDLADCAPDFEVQVAGGACDLAGIRELRRAGARAVVVAGGVLGERFSVDQALHG